MVFHTTSGVKCPVSAPPKHGSAQCNIKKNGIKESFVCTVSCKKGSWFLQGPNIPKLYNFYFCSQEGDWAGTMAYNMDNLTPTSAIIIPKGQPLWPDCSGTCHCQKYVKVSEKGF